MNPLLNTGLHDLGRHASGKSIVILMADDDADDRLLAKDALAETKLPGQLHFVEDGEQLLDYLHRRGQYGRAAAPDTGRAAAPSGAAHDTRGASSTLRSAATEDGSASPSARAEAPRPGLILLDLNMPKKDGREALREIKTHPDLRKIPVVVLTTSKADIDIAQIYDLGANSFITKPVTFDSLVKVMRILGEYWCDTVELPVKQ